jgi:hypothetical protein
VALLNYICLKPFSNALVFRGTAMSQTVLILIAASLLCVLIGAILTGVRAKKFLRGQRARENAIRMQSEIAANQLGNESEAIQE